MIEIVIITALVILLGIHWRNDQRATKQLAALTKNLRLSSEALAAATKSSLSNRSKN